MKPYYFRVEWRAQATMDRARLRLKAILMAKVKMAGSYKAQGKTQVK